MGALLESTYRYNSYNYDRRSVRIATDCRVAQVSNMRPMSFIKLGRSGSSSSSDAYRLVTPAHSERAIMDVSAYCSIRTLRTSVMD